jgi:hypothetical protein
MMFAPILSMALIPKTAASLATGAPLPGTILSWARQLGNGANSPGWLLGLEFPTTDNPTWAVVSQRRGRLSAQAPNFCDRWTEWTFSSGLWAG